MEMFRSVDSSAFGYASMAGIRANKPKAMMAIGRRKDLRKSYDGSSNWSEANQVLWLHKDAGLYRQARQCIHAKRSSKAAAEMMLQLLDAYGYRFTPDGAKFDVSGIHAAMRGM